MDMDEGSIDAGGFASLVVHPLKLLDRLCRMSKAHQALNYSCTKPL
jgi:hypothetical protein